MSVSQASLLCLFVLLCCGGPLRAEPPAGVAEGEVARLHQVEGQLQARLAAQIKELETLAGQRGWMADDVELERLQRRMLEQLEAFIRQDLPFQRVERLARVRELERMIERPEVQSAEKLRRLFQAYQQELGYGQNIEAWDGELFEPGSADQPQLVTFLRYGRVSLVYQSFDGKQTAWWNRAEMRWRPLPDAFAEAVAQGIRVALKRLPPDLLILPVTGPAP